MRILLLSLFLYACSPIKSSPQEEKHKMELTLHEIQTNVDDLRHDVNCYQTEMGILDGKIRHHESTISLLKQEQLEKQKVKIDFLMRHIEILEKKLEEYEKKAEEHTTHLKQLSHHADEVTQALTQYKARIYELEKTLISHNQRWEELGKIKKTLEEVAEHLQSDSIGPYMIYKVKAGDSLEKIARKYQVQVAAIKKINQLQDDRIGIGQELKIPGSTSSSSQ